MNLILSLEPSGFGFGNPNQYPNTGPPNKPLNSKPPGENYQTIRALKQIHRRDPLRRTPHR